MLASNTVKGSLLIIKIETKTKEKNNLLTKWISPEALI
jgi:hypothetical protein